MRSSKSPNVELLPDESIDEFMDGRLKLIQSKTGYRFSIDAILLSQFVTIKQGDRVVDLGTGCGIIPLILLLTKSVGYTFGLEIQKNLVDQAARNTVLNGFERKMGVILGDIKHPPYPPSSADVVTCNPPYRPKNSGRINPDLQRAIARHEMLASLDDILMAASRILRAKGRLAMIYPAVRLVEVLIRMKGFNLEPKRLRIVYPGMESEAKLALIEASLGGRKGLKVLPPLFDQGEFSI
ncbi:MAG: methyltransferase domain-containing protein [Deltaproteobacteria bacterium]|nr:MAG: methyltransferase domain-containing protein [Deltaproteobacteria bacterium]